MTLIAGFVCRDGLLICADMEEVGVGASKRKINKLFCRTIGDVQIILTGAGSSAVIDNAVKRMDDAIQKFQFTPTDENAVQDFMDSTLRTVYEKYVWPNLRTDHEIKLIVGYSQGLTQRLWITHDIVTTPEVRYVCAGIGEDLANYFADRLYHPLYSEQQMVRLAAFIFKEVKQNVSGVGQGTQMWMLRKAVGVPPKFYNYPEIELIEKTLPPIENSLRQHGEAITGPTIFPALPFQLDVPYVELCRESNGALVGQSVHNPREVRKLTFK